MSDRCILCHTDVGAQLRDPTSLHGVIMGSGEIQSCYHCHPEHRGNDAQLTTLDPGIFPHQATGYSLQSHQQTAEGPPFACADCHGEVLDYFGPTGCADCHWGLDAAYMQAHESTFGSDCLTCHDGVDTYGAAFDHTQTAYPLAGRHAPLDCADCHRGARSVADLKGTPQDCAACHQADDAHDGQFGQDCAACHTPEDWQQATFDHAQTAFPLLGRHVEVACQNCHLDNVYLGTPQDCFACHQADDAHDGQFGQDCADCHTPEDWQQATFDHAQTAFPLTGAHVETVCVQCHVDNIYGGTPQDCAACHQADDAHDGQFGQDCAACHTPDGWEQATFDHAQTAFPLSGAHVETACVQCHVDNVYRGTPRDCAACHDDPIFHRGLLGSECASCHNTTAWSPARYDRAHTFPINHGERGASSCQTCHPNTLPAYNCYGCHEHDPAGVERKHREEGISDFQDCVGCHPTGQEDEGESDDD
jgi:hypothetical protein